MFTSEYDVPFCDDDDLGETYLCQRCGLRCPRPALIVFSGQGETVDTATEYCPDCFALATGHTVIMPHRGEGS